VPFVAMAAEAKVNAIANTAIMAIVFLIISSLNYRLKIALNPDIN
jgi:hypothetical protein